MVQIDIYTKPWCPYSGRAINILNRHGLSFNEINVTNNLKREIEMKQRSGRTSVPQVFIGDVHVGGSDELFVAEKNGMLVELT